MSPSLITLIVNILLILFVGLGFLWGLGRGAKKSAVRLLYFIVFVVIAAILAPVVSNALLGIQIDVDGTSQSIKDAIYNGIASQEGMAEQIESSPAIQDLISNLPIMLVNVFVFVILVWLLKFVSWIGYLITCRIHFHHKKPKQLYSNDKVYTVKDGQPVVLTEVKEKKHRLAGGGISALQALIMLFLTLIPISGIANIIGTYANQTVSQTATVSMADEDVEYTEVAKFLRENIPEEVLQCVDAYNDAIAVKLFNIGGFNSLCFDSLTSITVDGTRISLRSEINTIVSVVDVYSYFDSIDWNNVVYAELDFDKIEKALKTALESGFLKSLAGDVINIGLGEAINSLENQTEEEGEYTEELISLLTDIKAGFNDTSSKAYNILKNDIMSIFGAAKVACQSGVVDMAVSEDVKAIDIINRLNVVPANEQVCYLGKILDNFFQSQTFKTAFYSSFNLALGVMEEELTAMIEEENGTPLADNNKVKLDRVADTSINWTDVRNDLVKLMQNIANVVNWTELNVEHEEQYLTTQQKIAEYDKPQNFALIKNAVISVGQIVDTLRNFEFFTGTVNGNNIIDQVIDNLGKIEEYAEMVNVEQVKAINFASEFNALADILQIAKDAGVYKIIGAEEDERDYEQVVTYLKQIDTETTKTNLNRILADIYDLEIVKVYTDIAKQAYIKAEDENHDKTVTGFVINWESLEQKTTTVLNNFVTILSNLTDMNEIENIADDIALIVNDNFMQSMTLLGQSIDLLLLETSFDYKVDGEDYNLITDVLRSAFEGDGPIDIERAIANSETNPTYWENEIVLVAQIVDRLNDIMVDLDEDSVNEKSMLQAIVDGEADEKLVDFLDYLSDADLDLIFNNVLTSDLFTPAKVELMNTINETIIELLDETVENEATDEFDFVSQKAEIIAVIKSLIPLKDLEATADQTIIDILTNETNKANFEAFLTALENNSDEGDFFKEAYEKFNAEVNEQIKSYSEILTNVNINIDTGSLAEEFDILVDVLDKAQEISDATDIEDMVNNNTTELENLLTTLQENGSGTQGEENPITKEIYDAVTDYLTDEGNASTDPTIQAIKDHISTNYDGVDSSLWDWNEILNSVKGGN